MPGVKGGAQESSSGSGVPAPPGCRPCVRGRPGGWPGRADRCVMFGRYRTVTFDGCRSVKVPDTPGNRGWLGKINAAPGMTGYPVIQLMTLCETGHGS